MTRGIVFSARADIDRDHIWDYTVERWSVAQAEDYLMGLGSVLTLLADHPQIASERHDIDPPVRLHRYKSHMVIFTAADTPLKVIRVVHSRSNWQALLAE